MFFCRLNQFLYVTAEHELALYAFGRWDDFGLSWGHYDPVESNERLSELFDVVLFLVFLGEM